MWPEIKTCKHKCSMASDGEADDRLSLLPDEILLLILSSLALKEAARTSLLSQRWKDLWRCLPTLSFTDPIAWDYDNVSKCPDFLASKRLSFVSWVNNVINKHIDSAIEDFRVSCNLDKNFQSDIHKWVDFAFRKHVKRLYLDLTWPWIYNLRGNYCTLPLECLPHNLVSKKGSLTSLQLREVDVTTEAVEHILRFFPLLETLCILKSYCLTHVRVSDTALALKHLELYDCQILQTIHISTPKLLSFKYYGPPVNLNIENATMLTEVFVGAQDFVPVLPSLVCLFKYFSQLEILSFRICLGSESNSWINHIVPALPNLKHLKLKVNVGDKITSVLGWISLIEASSQVLQKLTLEARHCWATISS